MKRGPGGRGGATLRTVTRALAATIAAIALLVAVAPASAGPIDDYRRDGTIDPCKYSDGQLKRGRNNLSPDVEQYAPGLADQLSSGREGCGGSSPGSANPRRTQVVPAPGASSKGGGGRPGDGSSRPGDGSNGPAAPGAGGRAAQSNIPAPPAPTAAARRRLADISTPPVSARINDGAPDWVKWLLLVLLALAALVAVLLRGGLDTERFTSPLRASFGDAGGRTADAAAELWDRVRLGR